MSRAFTVTTMKLTMNMTWAMKIAQKPELEDAVEFRKRVSREAPSTISGVDIGRNTRTFADAAAAEVVAHDRERYQRSEHRRDERREQRRSGARRQTRRAVPSTASQLDPVVERELLPDVVEAPRRLVEREEDDDGDRQHQVADHEDRVRGERVALDETHQPVELLRADDASRRRAARRGSRP